MLRIEGRLCEKVDLSTYNPKASVFDRLGTKTQNALSYEVDL